MKEFCHKIRVIYADTDQMGVVYYGNYPKYLEIARVEWLRSIGVSYKSIEEKGTMLPVADMHIRYKKPAKYDDIINIRLTLNEKPTKIISFDYIIENQNGEILAKASTKLTFVNINDNKLTDCPSYLLEAIAKNGYF